MRTGLLQNQLNFLVFGEIYQRFSTPKARRQAFKILKSAIQTLDKSGFEAITLAMVARELGITAPAVRHYFVDSTELTELAIKFIRVRYQKYVIEQVGKSENGFQMFNNYLDACFDWPQQFTVETRVWLAYMHRCARRPTSRQINTISVETGTQRLAEILRIGSAHGQPSADTLGTARLIQTVITGALLTIVSENHAELNSYLKSIKRLCREIAGVKGLSQ